MVDTHHRLIVVGVIAVCNVEFVPQLGPLCPVHIKHVRPRNIADAHGHAPGDLPRPRAAAPHTARIIKCKKRGCLAPERLWLLRALLTSRKRAAIGNIISITSRPGEDHGGWRRVQEPHGTPADPGKRDLIKAWNGAKHEPFDGEALGRGRSTAGLGNKELGIARAGLPVRVHGAPGPIVRGHGVVLFLDRFFNAPQAGCGGHAALLGEVAGDAGGARLHAGVRVARGRGGRD